MAATYRISSGHSNDYNYRYQYNFVVKEKTGHFKVLSRFIMITETQNFYGTSGQYISSLAFQEEYDCNKSCEFYICCTPNEYTRSFIQGMLNDDLTDSFYKLIFLKKFVISANKLNETFNNMKCDFYTHKNLDSSVKMNKKRVIILSTDKSIKLSINLIVTDKYIRQNKIIMNNPKFDIVALP